MAELLAVGYSYRKGLGQMLGSGLRVTLTGEQEAMRQRLQMLALRIELRLDTAEPLHSALLREINDHLATNGDFDGIVDAAKRLFGAEQARIVQETAFDIRGSSTNRRHNST